MRRRIGLILATLILCAAASAPPGPEGALAEARGLAQQGNSQAALQSLETWLQRPPRPVANADAAALHLEAARMAVASHFPERAGVHLAQVRRLASVFLPAPTLYAQFLRETARLYEQIGDFGAAAPVLETVVDKAAAGDPSMAAEAANALGTARLELRDAARAIAAFDRQTKLLGTLPPDPKRLVTAYVNLSNAEIEANDVATARQAWDKARQAAGNDPALTDVTDYAEAQILLRESRLKEAEELLQKIADKPKLAAEELRGHALLLLATARFNRGLLPEADRAAFAAADAYRAVLGDAHPVLGRALHTLGTIHEKLHDRAGAAAFFERASVIERNSFGTNSVQFQSTEIERAWLDVQNGDLANAARRADAALRVFRTASPPDRRREGIAHVLLGLIAEARGNAPSAVDNFRTGQKLIGEARGNDSPDLGFSLVRLGRLLTRVARYNEAAVPLDRALALYDRLGSIGTVYMADALTARAELRQRRGDRRGALDDGRRAVAVLRDRVDRNDDAASGADEFQRNGARELFAANAKLMIDLAGDDASLREELFRASQDSLISRAADAVRRSTIRLAAGTGEVGHLLREREDVADALRQSDSLLRAAFLRSDAATPTDTAKLQELQRQQISRLRAIDGDLSTRFPQLSDFLNPQPIDLALTRRTLAADEALLMTVTGTDALIVWTITADNVSVREMPVPASEIASLVERIRHGVDLAASASSGALPVFDNAAARRLYQLLIAPSQKQLDSRKHLVLIADGALQTIPMHLLLGDSDGDWLVRHFAITTALSASSLVAQRQNERPSRAAMALLGVGDPHFSQFTKVANASRGLSRGLRDALASLPALPETADELHRMAGLFPNGSTKVMLGDAATQQGFFDSIPNRYRILAFSTHALMAGQLPGLTEPAIVLTPSADADNNGLLTASELATLDMDADLVILSACNTAAPDGGPFADGFSGLARAFLHAGARQLLVSHWSVASEPTIELTTAFLAGVRQGGPRHTAEALQKSMLKMLDSGNPLLGHPAFWAPFVVVGG